MVVHPYTKTKLSIGITKPPSDLETLNLAEGSNPRGNNGFGSSDKKEEVTTESLYRKKVITEAFNANSRSEFAKWVSRANYMSPQLLGFIVRHTFFKFSKDGQDVLLKDDERLKTWSTDDDHYLGVYVMGIFASRHMVNNVPNWMVVKWLQNIFPFLNHPSPCTPLKPPPSFDPHINMSIFRARIKDVINNHILDNFFQMKFYDNPMQYVYPLKNEKVFPKPTLPISIASKGTLGVNFGAADPSHSNRRDSPCEANVNADFTPPDSSSNFHDKPRERKGSLDTQFGSMEELERKVEMMSIDETDK